MARGLPPLDGARLTLALRSEGSPYLWPRVWAAQTSDPAPIQQRIEQWLEAFDGDGERRCGMAAESTRRGGTAWAAVALRAKADLEDLPTRVRTGAWVDVRAKLLVKAWEAKVIVLGPTGAPRAVPTGLNQGSVRAGFIADRPGVWLVQVLSTLERGPEPVLEALVYVGMDAPGDLEFQRAPGETLTHADGPADLKWLIDAARGSEGLPVLARDPALDRVAQRHAEAMCSSRRLGHEIDGFGPLDRVEAAGLALRSTGENVAHAASLEGAHRALWSSPSHRLNLLYAGYDAVGLGIAPDPDGSVWVCELFGKR